MNAKKVKALRGQINRLLGKSLTHLTGGTHKKVYQYLLPNGILQSNGIPRSIVVDVTNPLAYPKGSPERIYRDIKRNWGNSK